MTMEPDAEPLKFFDQHVAYLSRDCTLLAKIKRKSPYGMAGIRQKPQALASFPSDFI
jgi:hypothetical protein